MKRIDYNGNSELIINAVEDANFVLNSDEFYEKISEIESFDYSNANGKKISELVKRSSIIAKLEFYKSLPIPPWSRANAYTTKSSPGTIFLNKRKLWKRSPESVASTIIHEYIHLVDHESLDYEFGHGTNDSSGKSNTVPYKIDKIAYELLTGVEAKHVFQHDNSK